MKKVIVIGGGFGGLNFVKSLNNKNFQITLIDKTNHHLFQPLLYQVATSALSPGDIARPIRAILKNQKNVKVILGEVISIDKKSKKVFLKDNMILEYDYLVVAIGARHSYFGNDHWEKFAPGLKTLDDALKLRERILNCFEIAEITNDKNEKQKNLTFVIVGGGPTGVEMSGAIAEIAKKVMITDFRNINISELKVILIEGSSKLLNVYPDELSEYTKKSLESLGVEIILKSMVSEISESSIKVNEKIIECGMVIWAAGNNASPVLNTLDTEKDRTGRAIVNGDLTIPGYPDLFVIGDAANCKDKSGNPLPGIAPVAIQQGKYLASILKRELENQPRENFSYFDKGTMATIGKAKAVVKIGNLKFTGLFAWLIWTFIHIMYLIEFRNKVFVMFGWIWLYIWGNYPARLIIRNREK